jgi:WD repeat-containing protein 61
MKPTKRVEVAHKDAIWSVLWKDNNVYTGSIDGTIKLWNGNDLTNISTSREQKLGVISICSTINNDIVSSCQDSCIRTWSTPNFEEIGSIEPGLLEAWKISTSPVDNIVASGTHQGHVNIWELISQQKVTTLETGNHFVMDTCFSHDGSTLASCSVDGYVNIFDLKTNQIINKINAHGMTIRSVKFSTDSNLLFTVSDDRHACVIDIASGRIVNSFSHSGMALCIDISPDSRHFVVGCANHTLSYWDLGMQRCLQTLSSQHSEQIWGVSFNNKGDKFISVGDDALIQMYES